MCLRPSYTINKGYEYKDIYSPYTVRCNCGKCVECRDSRIQDVLFRCDWQNNFVNKKNGFSVFVTLTFNQESLNTLTYEKDGKTHSVTTWNNKKFVQWRNAINTYFSRKYGYEVKYLATCERGKSNLYVSHNGKVRRGTSRPHYHVILWFIPQKDHKTLRPEDTYTKIVTSWSWSPRSNKCIDISDSFSKRPYSLFVAHNEPVGYVYNEIINRTEAEATKYVVKYCFKEENETLNFISDEDIKSSSLGISFNDCKPRTRFSNFIGLYFLDYFNICKDTIYDILKTQIDLSDGQSSRIPRYYIKRFSSVTDIIDVQRVRDESLVFNGTQLEYKYLQKEPLFEFDPETLQMIPYYNWRYKLTTKQCRTDFGKAFVDANIKLRAHEKQVAYHYYKNLDFSLPDFEFLPFSQELNCKYKQFRKSLGTYNICDVLGILDSLDIDEWQNLSFISYHIDDIDFRLLHRLDSSGSEHSFTRELLVAYKIFNLYHDMMLSYNSAVTRYVNQQNYINGIFDAVVKRPNLFLLRPED